MSFFQDEHFPEKRGQRDNVPTSQSNRPTQNEAEAQVKKEMKESLRDNWCNLPIAHEPLATLQCAGGADALEPVGYPHTSNQTHGAMENSHVKLEPPGNFKHDDVPTSWMHTSQWSRGKDQSHSPTSDWSHVDLRRGSDDYVYSRRLAHQSSSSSYDYHSLHQQATNHDSPGFVSPTEYLQSYDSPGSNHIFDPQPSSTPNKFDEKYCTMEPYHRPPCPYEQQAQRKLYHFQKPTMMNQPALQPLQQSYHYHHDYYYQHYKKNCTYYRHSPQGYDTMRVYSNVVHPSSQGAAPDSRETSYIEHLNENDVLFGRGGCTNSYVGNISFRALVKECQEKYLCARKKDKTKLIAKVVAEIRSRGGRFLERHEGGLKREKIKDVRLWRDVGDWKALDKTGQALREGAPTIRKQILVLKKKKDNDESINKDCARSPEASMGMMGKMCKRERTTTASKETVDEEPKARKRVKITFEEKQELKGKVRSIDLDHVNKSQMSVTQSPPLLVVQRHPLKDDENPGSGIFRKKDLCSTTNSTTSSSSSSKVKNSPNEGGGVQLYAISQRTRKPFSYKEGEQKSRSRYV